VDVGGDYNGANEYHHDVEVVFHPRLQSVRFDPPPDMLIPAQTYSVGNRSTHAFTEHTVANRDFRVATTAIRLD